MIGFSQEVVERIEREYEKRVKKLPELNEKVFDNIEKEKNHIQFFLKYLYANMPVSDMINYSYDMFVEFAKHGEKLRNHNIWDTSLPDDIFLDYIVFHRVNTESITFNRKLFWDKLEERVSGKSLNDAILEVNYWCAEEATYQASDDRTISAEAVYKNGIGRCGEESVFTVNALRSVGIPARQVYAHRWAHCDDNHAWVEVWINGEWKFLGACEPEEILNRGWFLFASSRAMMVNSRLFGVQNIDGELIENIGNTKAINQLERYAKTCCFTIKVVNEKWQGVQNVKITYELLNYSELVPIASKWTNADGSCSLITGKGSVFVTVCKGDKCVKRVVHLQDDIAIDINLDDAAFSSQTKEVWQNFDMYAPREAVIYESKLSQKQKEDGKKKFDQAVQKRLSKVARFPTKEDGEFLYFSRGNSKEIKKFLECNELEDEVKDRLLKQLCQKDFLDIQSNILISHIKNIIKWKKHYPETIYNQYLLNPRIDIEYLTPYCDVIQNCLEFKEFRKKLSEIGSRTSEFYCYLWNWIDQNIREEKELEYDELITTPAQLIQSKIGSLKSKKILFVAICRTLGVPARLNPITKDMEYYDGYTFRKIYGSNEENSSIGTIKLIFSKLQYDKWTYRQNFSIAKKTVEGNWDTLNFSGSYEKEYSFDVESGEYRIITTNRLPNGNQLSSFLEFQVLPNEEKEITLHLRQAKLEEMLEKVLLEPFVLYDENKKIENLQLDDDKKQIFIWCDIGKEPTEHIFNEIYERGEEFATFGERLNIVLYSTDDQKDTTYKKMREKVKSARILFDFSMENTNTISRKMYGDPDKLPLVLVVEKGYGIYSTNGYNVGTGDMLIKLMNM